MDVNKTLSLVASSVLMMLSQSSAAVGLGQVKVNSHLNEPLSLELDVIGEVSTDMSVAIASFEQAERLGIETMDLHKYKASIAEVSGKKVVVIESEYPFKEPIADLAIVLKFPGGELIRAVSAFIDPAIFSEDSVVQSRLTQSSATQATTVSEETVISGDVAIPRAPTGGLPEAKQYTQNERTIWGPTQRNDSLWKIATQLRSQYDASLHQLMMAIFQQNPQAFSKGRIDRLKMGYMLALPTSEQVNQLTNSQAISLFQAATRGAVATRTKPSNFIAIPKTQPSDVNQVVTQETVTSSVSGAENKTQSAATVNSGQLTNQEPVAPNKSPVADKEIALLQQRLESTKQVENTLQQENELLKSQLNQVAQRLDALQSRYAEVEEKSQQLATTSSTTEEVFVDESPIDREGVVPGATSIASSDSATDAAPVEKRNYGMYLLMFLGVCMLAFISLLGFYILKRRSNKPNFSAVPEPVVEKADAVSRPVQKTVKRQAVQPVAEVSKDKVQFDMIKTSAEAYFAYGRYKEATDLIEFEISKREDQPEFVNMLNEYLVDLTARIGETQGQQDEVAEYFIDENEVEMDVDDLHQLQESVLEELEEELKDDKGKLSKKAS